MEEINATELKTKYRQIRNKLKNTTRNFEEDAEEFKTLLNNSINNMKEGKGADNFQALSFDAMGVVSKRMRISKLVNEGEIYRGIFQMAEKAIEEGYFTPKQANLISQWNEEMHQRLEKVERGEENVLEEQNEEKGEKIAPRRLRFAEAVLARRTSQISIVLEKCYDSFNHQAVLRTVECLGIQNVYVVLPVQWKRVSICKKVTKGNEGFLTVKTFQTTKECIECLRKEGRQIWATDLSQHSISLESTDLVLPERMALVIGREADGVSQEMLDAADKRVYLPIHGFSESLNLSVATAMILQRLFFMCPTARGNLTADEKSAIRLNWYTKLAKNEAQRVNFMNYVNNPPPVLDDLRRDDQFRSASWVHKKIMKRIRNLEEDTEENYLINKKTCVEGENNIEENNE